MIDEKDDLYEIVGQELKRGEERPGLMARATAEAEGNSDKAKSLYIRYRIAELSEAWQRAAVKRARDEINLLISKHGAISEILEQARKVIGFDDLSLEEKLRKYLKFESPEILFQAGYKKHYTGQDLNAAVTRYQRVIERFPNEQEAKYARQQLENIRARGTLKSPPLEEIRALLAQPLTITSCKQLLTMLGFNITTQEPGKWMVQEPTGSKRFFYSFNELQSYTKETVILAFFKPDVKSTESPHAKSDAPRPSATDLTRPIRSDPNPVSRQSASHSEIKTSKQPVYDEQPSALDLWRQAGQPIPRPENNSTTDVQVQSKAGPKGVGGWLAFLVVGMMALGPLLGAGRIGANIMTAEQQYPILTSLDQWSTYKSASWGVFLFAAVISFFGGWGLVHWRDWSAVRRAKAVLWITGPAASLVLGVLLPIMVFGESNAVDAKFVGAFLGTVIAAVIWTVYLSKSKRVRNTYGTHVD